MRKKFIHASVHDDQRNDGEDECYAVGGRHAGPHSVYAEMTGQDDQERDQEDQLACQRQEDGDLWLAYTLEKVLDHDLAPDERIADEEYTRTMVGDRCQLMIGGEHRADDTREKLCRDPAGGGYSYTKPDAYP